MVIVIVIIATENIANPAGIIDITMAILRVAFEEILFIYMWCHNMAVHCHMVSGDLDAETPTWTWTVELPL